VEKPSKSDQPFVPSMAYLLATEILKLIVQSGISQSEAYAALGAAKELLPTFEIALVPDREEPLAGRFFERLRFDFGTPLPQSPEAPL
jgi:hypothetical protein